MNNKILEGIPNVDEAKEMLREAELLNPGPWIEHSLYVGQAAQLIAENCGMNGEVALALGMLHDIGRQYGVSSMKHIIDGYKFASEKGYYKLAKVCLTHSFTYKDIEVNSGKWDCSEKEYNFVKGYIEVVEYDDYDRLIQLCDALALPTGFCLLEKRIVDVVLRHGIQKDIPLKWKSTFEIKKYFEDKMGKSIYSILPGVVENTFEI